jgi:NitT/TauT family transport system substrate-binding protein
MGKILNEVSGAIFSLPWLVARDEGLFELEGVEVEFIKARGNTGLPRIVEDHRDVPSIGVHRPFEEREAAVYRACEWGQIRRSYDSEIGGQIIGKRSAIGVQALFSAAGSRFTHPQTLRNERVAVRFHAGSHYAALQQLEGFLERDEIKVVHMDVEDAYEAVKGGEIAAVSLMDPWITVAEKEGLQKIIETHYVGSEIAASGVDAETWAAANRALLEATRRINNDKRKYLHYLIDALPAKYAALITPEDFHLPRLRYADPEPYSRDEFEQTYNWLVGWGLVSPDSNFTKLVDNRIAGVA